MAEIIITEFMDQTAVDSLAADFDVVYDAELVDNQDALLAMIGAAPALVVRNRTKVRALPFARRRARTMFRSRSMS